MYEGVNCQNCKFFDDIMFMEECNECSLHRSKKEEVIKFKKK